MNNVQTRLRKKAKKGFSLTEMLIVILVIALLMAFIIPQLLKGPAAARDAKRIADLTKIISVIELYKGNLSDGQLPASGCLDLDLSTPTTDIAKGIKSYFSDNSAPVDPLKKTDNPSLTYGSDPCDGYYFYRNINNQKFAVYALMEANGGNVKTMSSDAPDITAGDAPTKLYAKFNY